MSIDRRKKTKPLGKKMFLSRRSWHRKLFNKCSQALHDIDVSVHQRPRLAFVDNCLKPSLAIVACMKAFRLRLVSTERAGICFNFLPRGAIWLPGDKPEAPVIPRAWPPISLALGATWKSFVALSRLVQISTTQIRPARAIP